MLFNISTLFCLLPVTITYRFIKQFSRRTLTVTVKFDSVNGIIIPSVFLAGINSEPL